MKRIILSRHGVRYPFEFRDKFKNIFSKDIVNWNYDSTLNANLTNKGALLELLFAKFLRKYLCINNDNIINIVANSTSRTYETARLLSLGLVPGRQIKIECSDLSFAKRDPWFELNYPNQSYINNDRVNEFDQKAAKLGIYDKFKEIFNLDNECLYMQSNTTLSYAEGEWLKPSGKLFYSSSTSDVMQSMFYDGFKESEIFRSQDFISDLKLILKAKDFVIDLIWNNPKLVLESEKNIYQLLKSCFYSNSDLNILVGHDTNIATVLGVLDIEVPELNQLEKYPIGSKLIFSVYDDKSFDLELAYFDYQDIRNFNVNIEPKVVSLGSNLKLK
uniref:Histidine acid phosphatase family protein n=1 Tax=Mycoplasmopsis bovis TaxID=28903 RepID=A0A1B3Q3S2_MYCBV|nr:histidine acid phosphatase family protein [Mycoplasmopsis bovis]